MSDAGAMKEKAERLLLARRDRLRGAGGIRFRVGCASAKGTALDPLTGHATGVLRVASLSENCICTYSLDRLAAVREETLDPQGMREALRWCAVGPEAVEEPGVILFCARHPAREIDHVWPSAMVVIGGCAESSVILQAACGRECMAASSEDSVADVLRLSARAGETNAILWGCLGLFAWTISVRNAEDSILAVVCRAEEYVDARRNMADECEPARRSTVARAAPVVRGLFGSEKPAVAVRIHPSCEAVLMAPGNAACLAAAPVRCVVLTEILNGSAFCEPARQRLCKGQLPRVDEEPLIVAVPGTAAWALHTNAETARTAATLMEQYLTLAGRTRCVVACERVPPTLWSVRGDCLAPKQLRGRIALVTGGGSGIGLAISRRLWTEGACVAMLDLNGEGLQHETRALAESGSTDRVAGTVCDVRDPAGVERAFEETVLRWGGLDILVNCAGLSLGRSLEETTAEDYDLQNDVMPRGSFLCSQQAARIMREQGHGGDIVYIVSKNALFAGPNNVAYGTAKAAQLHQARLLAAELAGIHVRVNVVNPDAVVRGSGIFASGWGKERAQTYGVNVEDLGKYYATRSLLKEEILPEDIAGAVFTLVGPELRKSTGLVINVDGGFAPSMVR